MNDVAPLSRTATFRVEAARTPDELASLLLKLMPLWGELHQTRGQSAGKSKFNPDMETITRLVGAGVVRFITASVNDEIVAYQQWTFVPDVQCLGNTDAIMTAIYRRVAGALDTTEFVRFGIAAMKTAGASRVLVTCRAGNETYMNRLTSLGGRLVEHVLEV